MLGCVIDHLENLFRLDLGPSVLEPINYLEACIFTQQEHIQHSAKPDFKTWPVYVKIMPPLSHTALILLFKQPPETFIKVIWITMAQSCHYTIVQKVWVSFLRLQKGLNYALPELPEHATDGVPSRVWRYRSD